MWALGAMLAVGMACRPAGADEEVAPGLHVGDVLDQRNAATAKDLLPPEILHHYETGEYRNRIVAYPPGRRAGRSRFSTPRRKTPANSTSTTPGRSSYTGSGKQPDYVYGIPFPIIDPNDPKAAVKIVWNQFLAYWSGGSRYNVTLVAMLQPKGMDRDIDADGWFMFWDGQAEKYRHPNPMNLQSQFLGVATFPTDLDGTASLTWRYRDPDKRDSVWAFVPALRRVRAVSPANRSDGYLGSDISGDDGFFFDGKPEDFEWKLIGKRDALAHRRSRLGRRHDSGQSGAARRLGSADLRQPTDGRLSGSELEGHRVGADQRRAGEALRLGDRGGPQGQVLSVRPDRALDRRRDLGRRLESQVQLARRVRARLSN